jgi:hypothetical protein
MADYYDDSNNYLFVRKGKDNKLHDYIFVHLDDEEKLSFLAHYESYKSDIPLEVYRLEKIDFPEGEDIPALPEHENITGEQIWKEVRVNSILPSKWRMFFEQNEENLNHKT